MHRLPEPSIDAETVYGASHSRIRLPSLKQRHVDETPNILDAAQRFSDAARADEVHLLKNTDFETASVSADEMKKLYGKGVQRRSAPGRPHYDELMSAAPHGRCPYCGERRVGSIDHYLPKSTFSSLAVAPVNMVPACSECNHAKGSYRPSASKPAILHPYFDDIDRFRWLYATVEAAVPPAIGYEARGSAITDVLMRDRVERHFTMFKLAELYRSHAGQVVDELDRRLLPVFKAGGEDAIRSYLEEEIALRSVGPQNTWLGALYEALAESDWYCSKNFL